MIPLVRMMVDRLAEGVRCIMEVDWSDRKTRRKKEGCRYRCHLLINIHPCIITWDDVRKFRSTFEEGLGDGLSIHHEPHRIMPWRQFRHVQRTVLQC